MTIAGVQKPLGWRTTWQAATIVLIGAIMRLGVNNVRSDKLPLVGDWSQEARLKTPSGESMVVLLDEAKGLFSSGGAIFVDARSSEDYRRGHIAGALCLPWQEFDDFFDRVIPDLPLDVTVVAYCDGENCDLSKHLAHELYKMGYEKVRVLVNGWSLWVGAGLPTEQGVKNHKTRP
jgi:rhodanese-related sulfurtransferase